MTQEEKQLLLIDLCARLPYKTLYAAKNINYGFLGKHYIKDIYVDSRGNRTFCLSAPYSVQGIENIMPYLRPMSSMTKEERKEYYTIEHACYKQTDWLNEHHFDYRGLIEKGLALEAPKGMYNETVGVKKSPLKTFPRVNEFNTGASYRR